MRSRALMIEYGSHVLRVVLTVMEPSIRSSWVGDGVGAGVRAEVRAAVRAEVRAGVRAGARARGEGWAHGFAGQARGTWQLRQCPSDGALGTLAIPKRHLAAEAVLLEWQRAQP